MAVATTSGDECCDAPEVDTTSGGMDVDVEEAAGPFRVNAVGRGSGDEVGGGSLSPFGVTITAAWAVIAVKDRTVTFCTGSTEVVVGVTYVPQTHFPTFVPLNCLETAGMLSR